MSDQRIHAGNDFGDALERAVEQFEGRGVPVVQLETQNRELVRQIADSLDASDGASDGRIQKESILNTLDTLARENHILTDNPQFQAIREMVVNYPFNSIEVGPFRTVLNTAMEARLNEIHGGDWHVNASEIGTMNSPEHLVALLQQGLDRIRE